MIRFQCPACGKRLEIPETHVRDQGRCPSCREQISVPTSTDETDSPIPTSGLHLKEEHFEQPPPARSIPEDSPVETEGTDQPPPGIRKHPVLLDVLLYPTSIPGLVNLLVFWLLLPLIAFVTTLPVIHIRLLALILGVAAAGYFISYLNDCVRDSAAGETRAPESAGTVVNLWEAIGQSLYTGAAIALFVLPCIGIYYWRGPDTVFWAVVILCVLCFPMALLSTIMLNSVSIFFPWLWIGSIASTLLPYVGLLVRVYVLLGTGYFLMSLPVSPFLLMPIQMYALMISAHLLGRFFFRYEERLNWEA